MMPTNVARQERSAAAPVTIDLLLALVIALLLAVTARGEPPRTGLATSENFTIWADSQPQAEALLERAEAWRRRIAAEWLGDALAAGAGRASLDVRLSHRDAARTWLANGSSGDGHLVWIETTREKLEGALAHEIAHVVLATRYPELPPFAQEGIAGRYDDRERHALRRQTLERFVRTGDWPPLRSVLEARSLAPSDRAGYATAVSLTEFLLSRGDRLSRAPSPRGSPQAGSPRELLAAARTLLAFAEDGGRSHGWDAAVARYYGLPGVPALEREWREWLSRSIRPASERSGGPVSRVSGLRISPNS